MMKLFSGPLSMFGAKVQKFAIREAMVKEQGVMQGRAVLGLGPGIRLFDLPAPERSLKARSLLVENPKLTQAFCRACRNS